MNKKEIVNLRLFFIFSYLMFWILLVITGILISLKVPVIFQDIMKNICAWTPNFVLFILFRKLLPDMSINNYIKRLFSSRVKISNFIISLIIQVAALVIAVCIYLFLNSKLINSLKFIDIANLLPLFLITITAGAMGEELGWRGYALGVLQKQYSPIRASLILGVVWGFWHLPLWLLSGYSGFDLVIYINVFLISIISTSIIISNFYYRSKNILMAIWIHFWFNFLLKIVNIDILKLLIYLSFIYLVIAAILTIINKKFMLKKPELIYQIE